MARRGDEGDRIRDLLDRFGREGGGPAPQQGGVESPEYRSYREAAKEQMKKTWYERLVDRTAFFRFSFDDMAPKQRDALRLLDWDIEVDQIAPAATVLGLLAFLGVFGVLFLPVPLIFRAGALTIPFLVFYYILQYPVLRAKNKVVNAADELIEAVLYMAIYMRSSPNLEGAVSFAIRHLHGPVAEDLSVLMWKTEVREYNSIPEALSDYMIRWKPYNRGFVESLNILMSATRETEVEQRNEALREAVGRLLEYTKDSMEDFAEQLQLPVMLLYGLGILLPVLGIILFPLVGAFMGGGGMVYILIFVYNILLPFSTFAIMRNLLVGRPISFNSAEEVARTLNPGTMTLEMGDREMQVNPIVIAAPVFLLLMGLAYPHFSAVLFGGESFPIDPSTIVFFTEALPVLAVAFGASAYLILGYQSTISRQKDVAQMEEEFPEALYQLGNNLKRNEPIEIAITHIGGAGASHLLIGDMFDEISRKIRQTRMNFHDAVFDRENGVLTQYPSSMIRTVMEIIDDAISKGPAVAAESVTSISQYLKNIEETQQHLEDLIGDTLSSLWFLAHILAPVIAGVAVGMGSVISLSFGLIGDVTNQTQEVGGQPGGGTGEVPGGGGGLGGGSAGLSAIFDFESAIPPGVLMMIVGFYLIELSLLIGSLYVRLDVGDDPYRRNVMIGKIMLTSVTLYVVIVNIIYVMFSGILSGISL